MDKFTLPLAMVLVSIPFGSCAQKIVDKGPMDTEEREVASFRSVSLAGSGELRIHRGSRKLIVSADPKILPYVSTEVSGDRLEIGLKPSIRLWNMGRIVIDVTMPELEGLSVSGSGNAFVDRFEGDSFEAKVTGSGDLGADLGYERVEIDISGSGRIELEGSARDARIRIGGSGDFRARDFAVEDAIVAIGGSGNAELRASKRLEVGIAGSGSLRYYGSPKVETKISGSGSVRNIGD